MICEQKKINLEHRGLPLHIYPLHTTVKPWKCQGRHLHPQFGIATFGISITKLGYYYSV